MLIKLRIQGRPGVAILLTARRPESPEGTVAEILANPVDVQDVQLQGHLLRQTSHDKYIFSDGTGEIAAEIKAKRFTGQSVDERTKVEIIGEVDTGMTRPPGFGLNIASRHARSKSSLAFFIIVHLE